MPAATSILLIISKKERTNYLYLTTKHFFMWLKTNNYRKPFFFSLSLYHTVVSEKHKKKCEYHSVNLYQYSLFVSEIK